MAISADQQATLQLLLERGQSYGDLANLLGQDEAEVRARARAALTELGGADPDRHVGLTDYLLGQADPIDRADASRHLREDAADHALASELSESLRAMFPAAELPRLPGEPRTGGRLGRRPARATADSAPAGGERKSRLAGLSESQSRLIVFAAGGGVLLLVVVLAIAGVFGGGDDQSNAASGDATGTTAVPADEPIQRVTLDAVGGGNASGEALFGLATGDQPFVDISIEGLDPAPNDKTYVIWLMLTDKEGYPLSPIAVSENGSFQDRFSIPSAVLPLVARVQFVDVSIAPVDEIRRLVNDAIQNTALVLEEPGEVVLRGQIPKAADQPGGGGQGSGQ